jgi:predicted small secreted protein
MAKRTSSRQKEDFTMSISRSRLLSGIGLSLAFIATGTALAGYWCHRNQRISNRILTKVKRNFAKEGTIETSWIELQPLTINDHSSFETAPTNSLSSLG